MCTLISSDGSSPRSELYLNIAMICSLQAFTIRERRLEAHMNCRLDVVTSAAVVSLCESPALVKNSIP